MISIIKRSISKKNKVLFIITGLICVILALVIGLAVVILQQGPISSEKRVYESDFKNDKYFSSSKYNDLINKLKVLRNSNDKNSINYNLIQVGKLLECIRDNYKVSSVGFGVYSRQFVERMSWIYLLKYANFGSTKAI